MRGPAVQVAQKQAGGNYELQILGVGVGLRHRGMVIEHQRDASRHQDEKRPEGQRAQIPGGAEAEHAGSYFGREKMEEYVLLDGERAVQSARPGPAAEHRTPHPRAAQLLEIVRDCFRHAHTLKNFMGSICLERSTIRSPSSLSEVCSQGNGRGAGPSILVPGTFFGSRT